LRSTEADRAKIHQYFDEISHHQAHGDSAAAAVADANFHLAIAEASHNVVLIQMMRSLFDLLQYNVFLGRKKVYEHPISADLLSDQHFQVMDAIDRKDLRQHEMQCVAILNLSSIMYVLWMKTKLARNVRVV
jgi:GntR family L-lactate dehydrogenase operon transcriptional regulator